MNDGNTLTHRELLGNLVVERGTENAPGHLGSAELEGHAEDEAVREVVGEVADADGEENRVRLGLLGARESYHGFFFARTAANADHFHLLLDLVVDLCCRKRVQQDEHPGCDEAGHDRRAPTPGGIRLVVVRRAEDVVGLANDEEDRAGDESAGGEAEEDREGTRGDLRRRNPAREEGHAAESRKVHDQARDDDLAPFLKQSGQRNRRSRRHRGRSSENAQHTGIIGR